ncbi:ATP-binding cassette sub-family C member Sur isoform X2 [Apis mellifera]|uniref:ATP-binding cassette sub-family C member Sur isoform X2 n=1 Tax=Apis mellifera TaxID=7460 RepID=A0A7M7IED7_APIME|nr:ATP-binding cassette sub-family C member Sur isoform X2 [Apis mellifera]|eukprot:XP_016766887.2 ATP-binding cassette sub-family C member Sur isoform X2 [Apis mellifera]
MDFCKRYKFLRILPTRRVVWSWKTENGTSIRFTEKETMEECLVELVNIWISAITILIALIIVLKYKYSKEQKECRRLLPFHTTRTLLCMTILVVLFLELCESFLTWISCSSIITIVAILYCWILHRNTEVKDGFGVAYTTGIFAAIGLSRAWKFTYLYRYGLSILHVRYTTTAITAIFCCLFAILDSYTLYLITRRRRRYLIERETRGRTVYKHTKAPFFNKITFQWMIDLLSKGYKRYLDIHDLGQLPEEESTRKQFGKFRKVYEEHRERNKKLCLWKCFWKKIWHPFVIGGLLKLLGDAATLVGPLSISKILNYVSASQNRTITSQYSMVVMTFPEILENGYFLGLLVLFFSLLQGTLSQASTHILCVEGIRLKTALQALLYDKALRLYSWSIDEEDNLPDKEKEQNKLQQSADIGTLTNLISEDVYNVMSFLWIGHYTWAIPLKITAIIFLLYTKLGVSAIIGAVCCILIMTPLQLILGKKMSENSKLITKNSDTRLRLINEIFQGMRLVKLRAWENIFEEKIKKTRDDELKMLDKDSFYWTLINFLIHASSVLMTLFTFAAYFWLEDQTLDAGKVFASLALVSQLTVPLLIFPVMIPIIINAMISTKRMEEFLQLPEIDNVLPDFVDRKSEIAESIPSQTNSIDESIVEITKTLNTPTFGSLDNIKEDEENKQSCGLKDYQLNINSSIDTVFEKDPEMPILTMKGCKFSWGTEESLLSIDDLSFPCGQLTLIVGKTGSGKTSLLLGMLGEIQRTSGSIEWAKDFKIAYVAQKPWLQNATLRDNILFGSPYKMKKYKNVLKACALQPDVDILPGHDFTRIGEKGINLSGGQKQRVTIARAFYSDADIIIMDDPLSALDHQVGQQIFDQGIRKLLLRSGRTVIMVTHRLEFLSIAHQVVVMDGCRIRTIGTKSAIEDFDPELAIEWRKMETKEEDGYRRVYRTAKDRWSLIKLVSRIGNNAKNKLRDKSWITDQDAHVNSGFVPLRMRRTTLSGSRYLAHDLTDLPVSTEEWNVEKKRFKQHRNAVRSTSLQPERQPPPVLRQNSTPTILESQYIVPRKRNNTFDNGQRNNVFRQIFSSGIISPHPDEITLNRDKSVLRKLIPSNSNRQIQYNVKKTCHDQENEHFPVKRLLSIESKGIKESTDSEENYDTKKLKEQFQCQKDSRIITRTIFYDYIKAGGWIPSLIYITIAIFCQILRVFIDFWLSQWTDEDFVQENHDTVFYFKVYIILSIIFILFSIICNATGQWTGARARRKLHEEAISRLLRVPMSFFDSNPVGKILNRFSTDIGVIDKKISMSIQRLMFFVLLCGSAMIVNVIISPWFLIFAIPICTVYYLVQKFYRRSAKHLQRLDGSTRWPITTHFSETLCGLATIRASKQENRFMEEAIKRLDINTNAFLLLNSSSRWLGIVLVREFLKLFHSARSIFTMNTFQDYLGAIIVSSAIFVMLISAKLYPHITPALVGLAINYTLLVPIYLNWVVKFIAETEIYFGSVARISTYRYAPVENYQDGFYISKNWPNKGEIIFENVSLRYASQNQPVISNFSLRISAGQKIGICGRTGSGKSSTVMALFRLLDITQGRVLIDGIDVRRIPLKILRSRLSVIPQDVIMFSGTIRENLDPLSEYEDQELWNVLEIAQIKNVVASHPEGLNFEVKEGGENFSSGQLQLLCMARAILRKSSIVVFDEATSALDASTEKSLLKAISTDFENKTVIVIAHRVSALLDCDRVIVLHDGKIVEDGSPMDLTRQQDSFFANMLKSNEENETNDC